MATAYELRPGSTPRGDYKGARAASRRFLVDVAPDAIVFDGSISGLPAVNTPHPSIPGALADTLETSAVEGRKDMAYVDVLYSTDRRYGFPKSPVETSEFGFKSWGMEYQTVTREVPLAKRIKVTIPSPSGGAAIEKQIWAYGPDYVLTHFETVPVITRQVVLDGFDWFVWNAILIQNNNIHVLPDGLPYRFEAGAITQTTATSWETTYTWYGDRGTFAPNLMNGPNLNVADIIYPPGLASFPYSRLPFGVWQVVNSDTTPWPKFIETFPYDDSHPTGWTTLPGDPI